jgi:hypothetical protein
LQKHIGIDNKTPVEIFAHTRWLKDSF